MSSPADRQQLQRLYTRQNGLCHWCGRPMRPPGSFKSRRGVRTPQDLCTYDHHHDKFSPGRGQEPQQPRNVAACWQCNHDRGIKNQQSQQIDRLRQRARH